MALEELFSFVLCKDCSEKFPAAVLTENIDSAVVEAIDLKIRIIACHILSHSNQ